MYIFVGCEYGFGVGMTNASIGRLSAKLTKETLLFFVEQRRYNDAKKEGKGVKRRGWKKFSEVVGRRRKRRIVGSDKGRRKKVFRKRLTSLVKAQLNQPFPEGIITYFITKFKGGITFHWSY